MYDLAIGELEKFLQTFPQSNKFADALVYKEISQQKIGQYQEAIKTFEMLLSRCPG